MEVQDDDDDDLHGGQLRGVLNPTQIKSVTIITISGVIVFRQFYTLLTAGTLLHKS